MAETDHTRAPLRTFDLIDQPSFDDLLGISAPSLADMRPAPVTTEPSAGLSASSVEANSAHRHEGPSA